MRIKSLMLRLLAAAAFVASVSVSCSEVSFIDINPPADLQSKIDSIAAEKQANQKPGQEDLTIGTAVVGAEDYSSAWFTQFSDDFVVPQGKKLNLEFINHNGGSVNNWNNWNVCVATNGTREGADYAEFFVLRSDAYGWGNADYNAALIGIDYPDTDGDGDIWNDFRANMDGASVVLTFDYSREGIGFLTVTHTSTSGVVFTETYNQKVTGASVSVFLVADASYMEVKAAYLTASEIEEIPDEMAESIAVTGTPAAIELGSEDFWGNGVATVTFADGSTAVADTADVTFVVPDLSTVGTKTVLYSYSKTKKGNYGKAVAGTYTLEVTNPIVSISASATAYLIGGAKYVTLSPGAVKVEAVYADGTKAPLKTSQFTVAFTEDKVVYEGVEGTYADAFTATYTTSSGEVLEAKGALTIAKSALPAQETPVGLEDCTTPWWAHFSQDWKVAPYESQSVSFTMNSAALENWHGAATILRKADTTLGADGEYAVVRMDNHGWGTGFDDIAIITSNWNWDTFKAGLNNSKVSITVTNNGDNTASIRYYIISGNEEVHFQYYDEIAVDSADLQFAIVLEAAYLVFD